MVINVKNIVKEFKEIRALDSFNLELREKEILGLIGPNGSGKQLYYSVSWEFIHLIKGKLRYLIRN